MLSKFQGEVLGQAVFQAFRDGLTYALAHTPPDHDLESIRILATEAARRAESGFNEKMRELDVFNGSNGKKQDLDEFRRERAQIIRAECANSESIPRIVIMHLVPTAPFRNESEFIGIRSLEDQSGNLKPLSNGYGWKNAITSNGFRTSVIASNGKSSISFTQITRRGAIEAVDCLLLGQNNIIPIHNVERDLITGLGRYLEALRTLEIQPSASLMLSFLNVQNACLGSLPQVQPEVEYGEKIGENDLLLPETSIASFFDDPVEILHPLFDRLYNAAGLRQSSDYNEEGKWAPRQPSFFGDVHVLH